VAIIVVGPKDLPRLLRQLGQWAARAKSMAREFQNQFNEAASDAGLDEFKKGMESIHDVNPMNEFKDALDPVASAGDSLKQTIKDEVKEATSLTPDTSAPAKEKPAAKAKPKAAKKKPAPKKSAPKKPAPKSADAKASRAASGQG